MSGNLPADGPQPRFRKILWEKQPFPDNYQDETFLAQIQRSDAQRHGYLSLVLAGLPLSAHLSSTLAFVGIFVYLYEDIIEAQDMIWISSGVGVLGYAVWEKGLPSRREHRWQTFRSASMVLFLLLLLSPVLRTLTLSTAQDSVWALAAVLLLAHTLIGDYGNGGPTKDGVYDVSFPSALSLNAATFAAVVLASRLPSNASVFALVLFSVEWFALFPLMRKEVVRRHPNSALRPIVLTASLSVLTLLLMLPLSYSVAALYVATVPIGATFGVPAAWMWVRRYRNHINGPWDCAVPKLS